MGVLSEWWDPALRVARISNISIVRPKEDHSYTNELFKPKFVSLNFSRGFDVVARVLPIEEHRRCLRIEAAHTF